MKPRYVPVLALVAFLVPFSVSAHTLERDGTIRGTLHVSSDHHPTAGEEASLTFYMNDSARRFSPDAYIFTLTRTDADGLVEEVPVAADGSKLVAHHIFPHAGGYTATLAGSPTRSVVAPFTLSYDDISVLPPGQHVNSIAGFFGEHGAHVLVTGLIILIFLGVVVWEKVTTSRHHRKLRKNS
jgi:hypothetical protein